MTSFLISTIVFKLISPTVSQTACLGQYNWPSECNNATAGCIWVGSSSTYMEGDCYPNSDANACDGFYYLYECGYALNNCCWYNFTEGEGCTADCGGGTTPSPVTPAPIFNQIGDFCYCQQAANITEPTESPTQKPTKSPTTPGTKKTKDKSTSGTCAINGFGDCCCDKNFGQQSLTFINYDDNHRTIETIRWWIDGQSGDPADVFCEFNCIEYGESRMCNISNWIGFTPTGSYTPRKDPYHSFETNTYFDITYIGGDTCYSYFHTSCSSDIVGYFDAKDTNVCGVKCTSWTDANPDRIGDCNNNLEPCLCANNTLSPIPTATNTPSNSPTVFINSICIPTTNPTQSPTKNPIIQPTQSPSNNPTFSPTITTITPTNTPTSNTNNPTIQPSEAPTRTRAPSITPTTYTITPTQTPSQITHFPSNSPTDYSRSPSKIPLQSTLAPVTSTVQPSQSPVISTAQPSQSPVISTVQPSQSPVTSTVSPSKKPSVLPTQSPNDNGQGSDDDDDDDGGNGGKGSGLGNDTSDSGGMGGIIGGLIGGIVGAFLCGLLCAGVLFWKYKQKQAGSATNFSAHDEQMEVEIENANQRKVSSNPLYTNRGSFETYK